MVKPIEAKGIKPKTEVKAAPAIEEKTSSEFGGMKLILVNTVITVLICTLFIGSNYFIIQNSLKGAVSTITQKMGGEGEGTDNAEGSGEEVERGVILDLGEFILNLSDPRTKRYLKVSVAVELTKTQSDAEASKGTKSGGHGGEAADPMKAIEAEMSQFKPSIRDAIISTLSSKTADELSSMAGKEMAKEQIKEAVNSIFAGEREVLRVSFGNFIIQ